MDAQTATVIKTALICGTILGGVALQAWVNRRRSVPSHVKLDVMSARLERIEQAIDSVAVEMERVSEAQRFTARILAEKGGEPAALRGPGRVNTPH